MDRSSLIKAGQAASLKYRSYVQRRAARLEWFRALCESGESREKISELMGVSEQHVLDHARDHGVNTPQLSAKRCSWGFSVRGAVRSSLATATAYLLSPSVGITPGSDHPGRTFLADIGALAFLGGPFTRQDNIHASIRNIARGVSVGVLNGSAVLANKPALALPVVRVSAAAKAAILRGTIGRYGYAKLVVSPSFVRGVGFCLAPCGGEDGTIEASFLADVASRGVGGPFRRGRHIFDLEVFEDNQRHAGIVGEGVAGLVGEVAPHILAVALLTGGPLLGQLPALRSFDAAGDAALPAHALLLALGHPLLLNRLEIEIPAVAARQRDGDATINADSPFRQFSPVELRKPCGNVSISVLWLCVVVIERQKPTSSVNAYVNGTWLTVLTMLLIFDYAAWEFLSSNIENAVFEAEKP